MKSHYPLIIVATLIQITQKIISTITISNSGVPIITINIKSFVGSVIKLDIVKVCQSQPKPISTPNWSQVNIMTTPITHPSNWIIDSSTFHHIIFYL